MLLLFTVTEFDVTVSSLSFLNALLDSFVISLFPLTSIIEYTADFSSTTAESSRLFALL